MSLPQTEKPHSCSTCNKTVPTCGHKRKVGDKDGFCTIWEPKSSVGVKNSYE